jgi:hypothetical protein
MKTLIEHVESLSRYCKDRPELILWSILHNERIMDDENLLVYAINPTPYGNEMVLIWGDGNGDTLYEWTKELQNKFNCQLITIMTTRWRAMCRRFKMKPVGVMLEREG